MSQIDLPRTLAPAIDVVAKAISSQLGNSSITRAPALHRSVQTLAEGMKHVPNSDWLDVARWYQRERGVTDRLPFIADAVDLERIETIRTYLASMPDIAAIVKSSRGAGGMSRRMIMIFAVLIEAKKYGYALDLDREAKEEPA